MSNKLLICKQTREAAAESLTTVLSSILKDDKQISEKEFSDKWLRELQKYSALFPNGWYDPPSSGIGVLFGTTTRESRHNYKTLRSKAMWPREDIFLNKESGMAYLFASPVDKSSGIIGDFGLTIYLGQDEEVKDHLRLSMSMNKNIFNAIEIGKPLAEIFRFAEELLAKNKLLNTVTSKTDPTGRDYGHTIPSTDNDWSDKEYEILKHGDENWKDVVSMISNRRIFINATESTPYQKTMATTLEPRLINVSNQNLPMASFHTIAAIYADGTKELFTNFDEVFNTTNMEYMIN